MIEKTLKQIQKDVDSLITDFGGYWPPLSMLASVVEEVGELSREINAKVNIKHKKASEPTNSIGEELADTVFSLICLANHYKVDLTLELKNVLEKYRKRDKNRFN
ncbi:hypothetical protein NEF87_002619 [Candidatus Lokiarchaeum ossiferum]|uniref:NTP pyrophosphohydrolase MazG-like domain-containing protein n=1 Tax=Candidatus Lokiarchaeum ossiferum TaxID=2951803 RepID=A0ABY6HV46_9ARCH|nr:hypothetical protein NEF87_002619 [Candidatus Lokiarchaeum sp. B-35]